MLASPDCQFIRAPFKILSECSRISIMITRVDNILKGEGLSFVFDSPYNMRDL